MTSRHHDGNSNGRRNDDNDEEEEEDEESQGGVYVFVVGNLCLNQSINIINSTMFTSE